MLIADRMYFVRDMNLTPDFKMLNEKDFSVWRMELRKFLYHWQGEVLLPPKLLTGSLGSSMERADELLNSSIRSLELINASSASIDIKNVLVALGQVQEQHALMRQHLARRPRSETSRTTTPVNNSRSRPGHSPLATASPNGAAGTSASVASFLNVDADAALDSTPSSVISADEGDFDFYDADDMVNGVEYEMNECDHDDYGCVAEVEQDDADDDEDDYAFEESNADVLSPHVSTAITPMNTTQNQITYRKTLPAPVTGEEMSLFSILKKNVGKDLSTISFPVTFNAPLSILQAVAEEYEYAPSLLERAVQTKDPAERIALVGAFAVSGYASTSVRSSRKPFNPLLGETYECVRTDRRLHFLAEKVVHRPPVTASYAYGAGWKVSAAGTVKNKFWGKSLELIAEGAEIVELDTGDKYSIVKPSSFMRNLLAGTKYLEHVGEMSVTNLSTNESLVIRFKEGSMFGGVANRNHIEGVVYDANKSKVGEMKGRWDERIFLTNKNATTSVLWQSEKIPPDASDYYGFTYFAMSLNEITDDIRSLLPPTDSRLRPDQRALEDGDADKAEALKLELEGHQRERRKKMEAAGETYHPQWFHPSNNGVGWAYGGPDGREYFTIREQIKQSQGQWNVPMAQIFEVHRP